MGGNDTATYSGSALDETMTALAFYTFVNTISTVQYFDSFKTLTVAGNGGLDIAVMYDTSGVDSFTASDTSSATRVPACSTTSLTATTESTLSTTSAGSTRPRSTAVAVTTD